MPLSSLVREVPFGVFLLELAVPTAFSGVGVFATVRSFLWRRALTGSTTVSVDSALPGYVRVEGEAQPRDGKPLVSPLTDSQCCWYSMRVDEARWSSRAGGTSDPDLSWTLVREETSDVPFLVRDASGELLVDPAGADLTPRDQSVWYGPDLEPTERNPKRFGPSENPKGKILQVEVLDRGKHRYRYTEKRLYPGDAIVAQGDLRIVGVEDPHTFEARRRRTALDLEGAAADDRDDDADEAADAAKDAPPTLPNGTRILGRTDRWREPFLVAVGSPAELVKIYAGATFGSLLIALVGVAGFWWLLHLRFG